VAYSGEVKVFSTWLDPTAEDLYLRMPGDLRAVDLDNQGVLLRTFGMIGVELEGENGEALNLADGKTATIELPVPNSLLADAPATIPLWHFDEVAGLWIEEGEATLQDGKYVGQVGHFSFWNCDVSNSFIYLSGSIQQGEGDLVGSILIEITSANYGSTFGFTNADGSFGGFVPNDELLTIRLSIWEGCTDNFFLSQTIGPFSDDATLPAFPSPPQGSEIVSTIKGRLTCDGVPISTGQVNLQIVNGRTHILYLDGSGDFSKTVITCEPGNTICTVTGYGTSIFQQSETAAFEFQAGATLETGDTDVCPDLNEGSVAFTIGNIQYTMPAQTITSSLDGWDGYTTIFIVDHQQNYNIDIQLPEVSLNTDLEVDHFGILDAASTQGDWCGSNNCANLKANFSKFSHESGEIIKGHITGTMINEDGEEKAVYLIMDAEVDY
jgi:hypothetical protein